MGALSLLTSVGLGALHALEPGHGKTFLVSYTMGNTVNKKETIKIISSMAISHSVLLVFLALLVPVLFPEFEENIHFFIQLVASLLILFVGVKMLYKLKNRTHHTHDSNCSCGQNHSISQQKKENDVPMGKFSEKSFKIPPKEEITIDDVPLQENKTNPILVGIINGIMPCPSALAVVGLAFTYPSTLLISLTMIAYVLGFILAMLALLLTFVVFKKRYIKIDANNVKLQRKIQLISACIILFSGVYYLILAMNHLH